MTIARSRLPLSLALAVLLTARAAAAPSAEALAFFENKVRPVLVAHCYKCHGGDEKKPKGGLRLDSRAGALKGGDNGPALLPGEPGRSRLIEAVLYQNVELQMPPKGKLPDAAIADLTTWVKGGAAWPEEKPTAGAAAGEFDLARRKREHWAWWPVRRPTVPDVKDRQWPNSAVDSFLLTQLEHKGLAPAASADRRTLLRRVTFDLIGLPPTTAEIDAFLRDEAPDAYAKVVDRLLASPAYGERWARHWLDLVRYADSRGHEFDYTAPNAWQYRDYVVRALNADVPYDRFVVEQLAGDQLAQPRTHPTAGFNESVLGTGFWLLGEEIHSPVDIRGDLADRLDNRIDVLTKTFLGLTVSCARCHDHKFDAISTKDYYALFGILEGASPRLVRFDCLEHNRRIAAARAALRAEARPKLGRAIARAATPALDRMADYLLTAREAILAGPEFAGAAGDVVFEDFEKGTYEGWEVTGTAFGDKPQTQATLGAYQGDVRAVGRYFVNSHNVRHGEDVTAGDAHKGTLTSRPFTIRHDFITFLVGGGNNPGKTCVNLLIEGKAARTATGRNDNRMLSHRWDVRDLRGKSARIQIVDDLAGSWGNIGCDHFVFTDRDPARPAAPGLAAAFSTAFRGQLDHLAAQRKLDAALLAEWVAALLAAGKDVDDPLYAWAKTADANVDAKLLAGHLRPLVDGMRQREGASSTALRGANIAIGYAAASGAEWMPDEGAFGPGPVRAGEVSVAGEAVRLETETAAVYDRAWDVLRAAPGAEGELGALGAKPRAGRTLRTPAFTLTTGKVFYRVRGAGTAYAAVEGHALLAGPLHGQTLLTLPAADGFRWIAHDLTAYKGRRAHVEFTPAIGSDFAVVAVIQADNAPAGGAPTNRALLKLLTAEGTSLEALATGYARLFRGAIDRLAADRIVGAPDTSDYARLVNCLLHHPGLLQGTALREAIAAARGEQAALAAGIRQESRLALALLDASGADEQVFVRGSHKTLGERVPRRFLEALAGPTPLPVAAGSGRLELARQLTDPALNPFIARVIVNRLWHHLFGRGIVASTDNFGVLGEKPTHPELLDYLADEFVQQGWSMKKMVRALVLSSGYRMDSRADEKADVADPQNLLLHRMRPRRLEGEAIRDAMLAVSGRLDPRLGGPSVPIHLTPFLDGRGRPASGPVDGDGRRSLYLGVRRNFLSPFLLAFDTPIPFSTVGRRTVSNVPAQALILMNDPFVHQQANIWAKTTLARPGTAAENIDDMYQRAFGRPPTDAERAACLAFLQRQTGKPDDPASWTDLAHVLFNAKEFIYVR